MNLPKEYTHSEPKIGDLENLVSEAKQVMDMANKCGHEVAARYVGMAVEVLNIELNNRQYYQKTGNRKGLSF